MQYFPAVRLLASEEERRVKLQLGGTGLALIAGWVVLLLALLIWGGSGAYLSFADPVETFLGRDPDSSTPVLAAALHAFVVMTAALLCAGLPVQHGQPRALFGAFGQVFGGVIGAAVAFYAFRLAAPTDVQAFAAWLPTAVLGAAMVVMGLLYQWVPWRVRAFTPVVLWGGLTLVQALLWQSWLLPLAD